MPVGFLRDDLRELLEEARDEASDEDFTDVSAEDFRFLPLPFLFFGLVFFCFFCTFEGVAFGLAAAAAAGRFGVFAFLVLPPVAFVGGAGATAAGTLAVLEALERVVGAILLYCWDKNAKQIHHSDSLSVQNNVYEIPRYCSLFSTSYCSETSPEMDCVRQLGGFCRY